MAKKQAATNTSEIVFPQSALVGSLGEFARLMAHDTEVPEEFFFANALAIMGAHCGTNLSLDIGFDVDPRLYLVILGDSYGVKKSTAAKRSIEFFEDVPSAKPPHVSYGVASAEGLARMLEAHPNAILVYDELRTFIDKCQVQGSTLLPMVTSLFEGNTWENQLKSKHQSVRVENARLTLIGCCTTQTFADMWSAKALNIGLPNRLFIVNADRKSKVAWPGKPDEAEKKRIRDRISDQLRSLPLQMKISDEAKTAWERWYDALPSSPHANRLDTIGFRLLALIALTTDKREIDLETVEVVTSILNYELSIRRVTDPIDAENKIAQLEECIRRAVTARGPIDKRTLRQRTNADSKGIWAFNTALENLRKENDIQFQGGLYSIAPATRVA